MQISLFSQVLLRNSRSDAVVKTLSEKKYIVIVSA